MAKFEYISGFPSGEDRDAELREAAEKINDFKSKGTQSYKERQYNWIDSPIDHDPTDYKQKSFQESFLSVLPPEHMHSMQEYIQEQLLPKGGKAIGVEFGGPGSRAFSEFPRGFFSQTAGVTLIDHRDPMIKVNDAFRKHSVLVGNLLEPETYDKLDETLKGQKVDLILERLGKGWELLPREPYYLSSILQLWYQMLNKDGMMFVEVGPSYNHLLKRWGREMENHKDGIEFRSDMGEITANQFPVFFLKKLANAPEKLPLLDPRAFVKDDSEEARREDAEAAASGIFVEMENKLAHLEDRERNRP